MIAVIKTRFKIKRFQLIWKLNSVDSVEIKNNHSISISLLINYDNIENKNLVFIFCIYFDLLGTTLERLSQSNTETKPKPASS